MSNWPPIEDGYEDEFGRVDPDVYEAAGELWRRRGESFAVSTLRDESAGQRLMLKAAALVTRRRAAPGAEVENLRAYLYQTYKHLVLAELEKESGHRRRESEAFGDGAAPTPEADPPVDIERHILVQQLMRRMDGWTREVFELLTLGYSFEMIARLKNKKSNVIRSKFNKQLKRLMADINR